MSVGLPCIVTAVGGLPDVVGQSAILVGRRRPVEIADAVMSLVANDEHSARLGSMARTRAESYAADRQAQSYAALYAEVISRAIAS